MSIATRLLSYGYSRVSIKSIAWLTSLQIIAPGERRVRLTRSVWITTFGCYGNQLGHYEPFFARITGSVTPKLSLEFPVENRFVPTSTANWTSVALEVRNRLPNVYLPSMICVWARIESSFLHDNKVH